MNEKAPPVTDFGGWRKSSYSEPNGQCVEVAWRKSSYSQPNGNCVEVRHFAGLGAMRDSKNPAGPILQTDLGGFVAAVKAGTFDR